MSDTSNNIATCNSQFSWMNNELSQTPCEVGSDLITFCHDKELILSPLSGSSSGTAVYTAPNGASATVCSCSWAAYNLIEACTICQGFPAKGWEYWIDSGCQSLDLVSSSTYFPSNISFSNDTRIPEWAIVDPENWTEQTFNTNEAQEIASQNISDVTSSGASQPSASFISSSGKKVPVGAIVGGVIAGVIVLIIIALLVWYFLFVLPRKSRSRAASRKIDLNADDNVTEQASGNPLISHLHVHGFEAPSGIFSNGYVPPQAHQQQQQRVSQGVFDGYPVSSSQGSANTNALVPGLIRTNRNSRDSIPTVAEQLDEKRRIRAARQNSGGIGTTRPPLSNAQGRTGSSSRIAGGSQEDLSSSLSGMISHTNSQVPTTAVPDNTGLDSPQDGGISRNGGKRGQRGEEKRKQSRLGRRMVMNMGSVASGSEAGDTIDHTEADTDSNDNNNEPNAFRAHAPDSNQISVPHGGTVAKEGESVSTSDIIARVPGARVPNARERENPPPSYSTPDS